MTGVISGLSESEIIEQIGWYLARKSNTEPILVMRVEAVDDAVLTSLLALIQQRVSPIINVDALNA